MLRLRISIWARCSTLYDKVCQSWLATGRWFFPGPPVTSTNKTDRHSITEIFLKVALNTIKQNKQVKRNGFVYLITQKAIIYSITLWKPLGSPSGFWQVRVPHIFSIVLCVGFLCCLCSFCALYSVLRVSL
jgi:hypothetical protein